MELTDANSGDKIRLILNPIMFNRLFEPMFLHDDVINNNIVNITINRTTSVMTHFCLN